MSPRILPRAMGVDSKHVRDAVLFLYVPVPWVCAASICDVCSTMVVTNNSCCNPMIVLGFE